MLQAVFAHETGWAISKTTFKLGESQWASAKSLSLGIKGRPSGLALRRLPDMQYEGLTHPMLE